MKKHTTIPAKLTFSKETIRRLADTLTDSQLAHVEGGRFRQSDARSHTNTDGCE